MLKIYDQLKDARLVLNQSEFAGILGFKRGHVANVIKSEKGVPDEWIAKAKRYLEENLDTGRAYKKDTDGESTVTLNMDLEKLLNERIAVQISVEATVRVLKADFLEFKKEVIELKKKLASSKEPTQSFSSLLLDIDNRIDDEISHILKKFGEKQ